jgi:pilus assembly protein CpaB
VLGMDLNADPTSDKPASPDTATVEVSVEDSQKLSVASTLGTLSLALRRNGAAEITDARPLRTNDFLVGGARPAARATRTASAGPARPYSAILIVEGERAKRGGGGGGGRAPRPAAPAPAPSAGAPAPSASGASTT